VELPAGVDLEQGALALGADCGGLLHLVQEVGELLDRSKLR
jgi:hypothetical protein